VPTPPAGELAHSLADLARRVRTDTPVDHAVVGVPGRVDYEAGAITWGRGLPPEWLDALREPALSRLLGGPVFLANDADLATLGEACYGAGRGRANVAYLTISSGVGAGAVVGGRLLRSRTKLAEIGLTILGLPGDGRGEPILLEDLGSGRALEAAGGGRSAAEIVAAARDGDPGATETWATFTAAVSATAVNIAHLLVPDVIVIGGGVSSAGELLLEPVRDWLRRYGPQELPHSIEVRQAELGDDAALAGAAAWRAVAVGSHRASP
jgi:predicted NBD/HSP70 family sugar kinase